MASWGQGSNQWSGQSGQSWSQGGNGNTGGGQSWSGDNASASAGGSQSWSQPAGQSPQAPAANTWSQGQQSAQSGGGASWNQQASKDSSQGQSSWNQGGSQQAAQSQGSWNQGGSQQASGGASWEKPAPAASQSWQAPAAAAPAANSWSQPSAGASNANSGSWGAQQAPAAATNSWNQPQNAAPMRPPVLAVAGCTHPTIGSIVRGNFSVESENHNKPVYKKDCQVSGLDVMIYFWDERDGPSQAGWWFGPKVGGEQVWAYNPDKINGYPPKSGWQVPYGGPVDPTFNVDQPGAGGQAPAAGGWTQPQAQPQQQSWQQPQAQQQPPQQQSWQQPQAQQPQAQQSWNQPAPAPAAPAQQGWGAQAGGQQAQQWGGQQAAQQQQQQQVAQQQQQAWQQNQQAEAMKKQQQMEEMKRRQEENKKKLEEARQQQAAAAEQQKKLQAAEQQKKLQEMQALRQQAVQRKQEQEAKLKEEMAQKKAEEDRRRIESKSTFAIRRCIQKVRIATPETFEAMETELQAEIAKELDNCGTQKEKIQEEVAKGRELATARIVQLQEAQKKEEEKKAEQAKIKQEKMEKAKALCEQLTGLVEAHVQSHESLKELTKDLDFDEKSNMTVAQVENTFKKVAEGEEACKAAHKVCMDLIKDESAAMKDPAADTETKQACAKLLQRIQEIAKAMEATMVAARGAKENATRRAKAQEKSKAFEALFKKYDKDGDKALSQKEVLAYAQGEFKVKLDKDALDWIWKSHVEENSKGVKIDKFMRLPAIIGVTRELARDKIRTSERIQKEAVIGGMRDKLKEKVNACQKFVTAADTAVVAAEEDMGTWCKKGKVMSSEDMISQVDKSDKAIKALGAKFDKAKAQMGNMGQGIEPKYKKDLEAFLATEAKKIEIEMGRMEARINRVKMVSKRFRDQAHWKDADAIEQLQSKALKVLRHNQALKEVTCEALFDSLAGGKDSLNEKAWLAFFGTAVMEIRPLKAAKADEPEKEAAPADETAPAEEGEEKKEEAEEAKVEEKKEEEKPEEPGEKIEISAEELSRVFAHLDEDGNGSISKENFLQMGKRFMRVVKDTAMTSGMGLTAKALRKLELKEVVEILKGPVKDDGMSVSRVFCKALKDDLEGWVSVATNKGSKFLEDGSALYKVIRETGLMDSFEDTNEADSNDSNRLRPGTLLEVREVPRKEETSGLTRMKGRVLGRPVRNGIGWVTTQNKEGKVFVKNV